LRLPRYVTCLVIVSLIVKFFSVAPIHSDGRGSTRRGPRPHCKQNRLDNNLGATCCLACRFHSE
jgi:hypothetical protein